MSEDLFSLEDREIVPVEVPEWKRTVYVRSISVGELFDMESAKGAIKDDRKRLLALELATYLCDQSGTALYTPEQAIGFVLRRSLPIWRILRAARKLNVMEDEQETLRGNS